MARLGDILTEPKGTFCKGHGGRTMPDDCGPDPTPDLSPADNQSPQGDGLNELCQRFASMYGIDWLLVRAIAEVESSGGRNPAAFDLSRPSLGVMQINVSQTTDGGVHFPGDQTNPITQYINSLKALDLANNWAINVKVGTMLLAANIKRFGRDFALAVAAYNVGRASHPIPDSTDAAGNNPYCYVKHVSIYYAAWGGTDFFKGGDI